MKAINYVEEMKKNIEDKRNGYIPKNENEKYIISNILNSIIKDGLVCSQNKKTLRSADSSASEYVYLNKVDGKDKDIYSNDVIGINAILMERSFKTDFNDLDDFRSEMVNRIGSGVVFIFSGCSNYESPLNDMEVRFKEKLSSSYLKAIIVPKDIEKLVKSLPVLSISDIDVIGCKYKEMNNIKVNSEISKKANIKEEIYVEDVKKMLDNLKKLSNINNAIVPDYASGVKQYRVKNKGEFFVHACRFPTLLDISNDSSFIPEKAQEKYTIKNRY